ncbi:MAG: NAD(P)H-dependent oxidoreductase subunit E, partial [Firmicutes bacterium]|nr:NAD(P)H-dependent oxidoreductase subunit E [Bacillota bacterium]
MACNCANGADKEKYAALDAFIDSLPSTNGELIRVLHTAQGIFGYLPREVQIHVAKKLDVPVSKVYGVVSFYSFFSMKQKGKYDVSVCMGTACYVRGAEEVLNELKKQLNIEIGDTTADGKFSLRTLRCVGACGLAPVVMIGEKVYGRVTPDMVAD